MTNIELLRQFSVEEMAMFLVSERQRIVESALKPFNYKLPDNFISTALDNTKHWLVSEVEK